MNSQIIKPAGTTATNLGFWSALLMAVVTLLSLSLAVTTLPISGPFCQTGCVTYPYEAVAAYVPHDYIWMIPAIFIAPIFVVLLICVHRQAPAEKKIFTQIGAAFALAYAAAMTINYFIQLEVMQPSILKGEMDGLVLFSQYNPHGIFIALENIGYLMMSLAFFFIAWAFDRKHKPGGALRYLLLISSVGAFLAFGVMTAIFKFDIEYRFEVFIISINWLTAIVMGILLAVYFKRVEKPVS